MDFGKIDKQLEEAKALRRNAADYQENAKVLRATAQSIENEALGSLLLFKVGDIIEYTTVQGYSKRRTVTQRMKVTRLNLAGTRISVNGVRYNARLEPSGQTAYMFIPDSEDKFVRVLQAGS